PRARVRVVARRPVGGRHVRARPRRVVAAIDRARIAVRALRVLLARPRRRRGANEHYGDQRDGGENSHGGPRCRFRAMRPGTDVSAATESPRQDRNAGDAISTLRPSERTSASAPEPPEIADARGDAGPVAPVEERDRELSRRADQVAEDG